MMTNAEWNEEDVKRMNYDSETWEVLSEAYKNKWERISAVIFVSMVIPIFLEQDSVYLIWIVALVVSFFKFALAPSSFDNPYKDLNTNPKYLRKIRKYKEANKYAEMSMGIDKVEK